MSSTISEIAMKSVVTVVDRIVSNEYCTGCVIFKDKTVRVVASADFIKWRENRLKVVFFDKTESPGKVVGVEDNFCSIETAFHSGCEPISLLQDEHGLRNPQPTFMFVPRSHNSNEKLATYVTLESLESYESNPADLTVKSTNYFLVSCDYSGKTPDGVNRLIAAPVFTTSGKTAGIVLQDCRAGTSGSELKVTLKSTYLHDLMVSLDPPAPPSRKKKKKKNKKRKRKH